MKKRTRTPWFDGEETPVRAGIYERIRWSGDTVFYSYWDGQKWWPAGVLPKDALAKYLDFRNIGVPKYVSQVNYWRGIVR